MSYIAGVAFYTSSGSTFIIPQLGSRGNPQERRVGYPYSASTSVHVASVSCYSIRAKLLEAATFSDILSPFNTLPDFVLIV